ncbi:hypothetical protein BgiMline_035091 [Biomphalaria glabrata]|uniref:Uncharacterized protein LOC106051493 isoform X1 n=2 Tax=Biomphalaria glabrata TaxID=6526 RepID=A0A9U8DV51_BIOGL|nr:uncharacterized protein LOC106051493 isoform X1 [Biomphalaria glabrata]KAI8736818.1 CAunnamed protein product [Biomphalaria glabrata]KAI8776832.1 CAunnamed protein product [Biomphalaria glabrata]
MSGYPMPFMPEERGCFCCEPSVPSASYANQFQNVGNGSKLMYGSKDFQPTSTGRHQECKLSPLIQNIQICDPFYNQDQSLFEGFNSNNIGYKLDSSSLPNEDVKMFIPSTSKSDEKNCNENSSVNLRFLQNREIGGKLSGSASFKSLLSSSAPVSTMGFNVDFSQCMEDSVITASSNSNSMDLDSALDELGMLSTTTNSRKQFLLETRGLTSLRKREQRLRSKSESSPNLTNLGKPNGFRIIQLDSNYVTSVSDVTSVVDQGTSMGMDYIPHKSQQMRLEYRNPDVLEESIRRRRSIPRMSRLRKDRYRRSRCPYKIPNRLYHSMQESDFGSEFFETGASPFLSSNLVSSSSSETFCHRVTESQGLTQSKSNTASPVKPSQELRLVRSLSAEDLTQIHRRFEQELNEQVREKSRTEQSLDLMTCQMTNLHMT